MKAAAIGAAKLQAALGFRHWCLTDVSCRGASIGIATYPTHGSDADTLLRRADIAMYAAKRRRGVAFATYAPDHDITRLKDSLWLARYGVPLRSRGTLHYQPLVDCATAAWRESKRWCAGGIQSAGLIGPDRVPSAATVDRIAR